MTWQEVSKEEAQRDEVENWGLVLIVVATVVESAFFFQRFYGTFSGRRFQWNRREKLNKQKPTFPIAFLCFFVFPFLFLSFFHSFFLSVSLAFFLSFCRSLSLSGRKITKITKITENHRKHQNHQKSLKFPKITENPIKIGLPKITLSKIRKHYENRAEKILGTQHAKWKFCLFFVIKGISGFF